MADYGSDAPSATPPVLPPKPGSHEASGISTPTTYGSNGLPLPSGSAADPSLSSTPAGTGEFHQVAGPPDPGDHWLPKILEDKSKQDLAEILSNPQLLHALTHSPSTAAPSTTHSHAALLRALDANGDLAAQVSRAASRLAHQRAQTQSQLLSTHALERAWRGRQGDMDHALAPFSPASLYQQLGQGLQEQAAVCQAMEESFLEGEAVGGEREVGDWVKRYREARVQFYLRQERKERWDEGRVGGWR